MLLLFPVEPHTGGRGCTGVLQPGHTSGHSVGNGEGMQ